MLASRQSAMTLEKLLMAEREGTQVNERDLGWDTAALKAEMETEDGD